MDELVEEVCRRLQAGLAPLKQEAAPPSGGAPHAAPSAVKQELTAAAETVKREVSLRRLVSLHGPRTEAVAWRPFDSAVTGRESRRERTHDAGSRPPSFPFRVLI